MYIRAREEGSGRGSPRRSGRSRSEAVDSDRSDREESDRDSSSSRFRAGDRIQAMVPGWSKFYPGQVEKVLRDGTLNLVFDDGDRKSSVEPRHVRKVRIFL